MEARRPREGARLGLFKNKVGLGERSAHPTRVLRQSAPGAARPELPRLGLSACFGA
jgi:hypothetical protein